MHDKEAYHDEQIRLKGFYLSDRGDDGSDADEEKITINKKKDIEAAIQNA